MGLFDDIKVAGAAYRLTEEALFAEALREAEAGKRRDGLWAMALSETEMDEAKAKARYLKLRVQSLKDEATTLMEQLRLEREANRHQKPVADQPSVGHLRRAPIAIKRQKGTEEWRQDRQKGWRRWLMFTILLAVPGVLMFANLDYVRETKSDLLMYMFVGSLFCAFISPCWLLMLLVDEFRKPPIVEEEV